MKRMNRILSMILVLTALPALCMPALAAEGNSKHYSHTAADASGADPATITVYETQLLKNGTTTGEESQTVELTESLAALNPTKEQPLAAVKYASWTEADAAEGKVKIDIDVKAMRNYSTAVDVVFVIDHSGGMNMLSDPAVNGTDPALASVYSQYTSPCLNGAHYYRLPVRVPVNGVTQYFWYYIRPMDFTEDVNSWTERSFINAIKKQFVADYNADDTHTTKLVEADWEKVYLNHLGNSGLTAPLNYTRMIFSDYHYTYTGAGDAPRFQIYPLVTEGEEHTADFTKITYSNTTIPINKEAAEPHYCSPSAQDMQAAGCYDRITLANEQLAALTKNILANNSSSRVGTVLFAGGVKHTDPLDSSVPDGLSNTDGYDNTYYIPALQAALGLFTDSPSSNEKYVIFVTDGRAQDQSGGQFNTAGIEAAVQALTDAGATLYTIGISLGDGTNDYAFLKSLATSESYSKNCKSEADFQEIIGEIQAQISTPTVVDIIGKSFDLAFPVTLYYTDQNGEEQTLTCHGFDSTEGATLADLGITYVEADEKFVWNVLSYLGTEGARLSFYEKLADNVDMSELAGNTGDSIKTNDETTLHYYVETNGVRENKETPINTPATIQTTKIFDIKASLACDRETASYGDDLTYTVELNSGEDIQNVCATVPIPAGTTLVPNQNLTTDSDGNVVFTVNLDKDVPTTVGFKVQVTTTASSATIENTARLSLTADTTPYTPPAAPTQANPDAVKDVSCSTNTVLTTVRNTSSDPAPVKQPNVSVSKASTHTAGDSGEYIAYTLTAKNSGNATAYGVWVKDYMPQYTHFSSVDAEGKYGVQDGAEYVRWFIESLAPGESRTMTFTVTVDACLPEGAVIRNTGLYETTGESGNPPLDTDDPDNATNTVTDNVGTILSGAGSAVLTKVDAEDAETVLSGARFRLYKKEANGTERLIGIFSTGLDGKITVNGLSAGEYYWQEISAPAAYSLDAAAHAFSLSEGGTARITASNTRSDIPQQLNGIDHYAYVIGYPDGNVSPEGEITRAEVASIFFRLLDDGVREQYMTRENSFSDVNEGDWYCCAVSTMAAMGVVNGYPDGSFDPNGSITRAEFAAIAARFDENGNTSPACFSDIYEHWGRKEINIAANNGWVLGYEDGTFRPDQYITRAEAMAMTNRVLQRIPQTPEDLLEEMVVWPDNADTGAWYYLYVQEATNSHYFERKTNGYEAWLDLRPVRDWTEFER